jgi:hypothetical protein
VRNSVAVQYEKLIEVANLRTIRRVFLDCFGVMADFLAHYDFARLGQLRNSGLCSKECKSTETDTLIPIVLAL